MTTKTKRSQVKTPYEPHGRDLFQTPAYATNLLIPFIPKNIKRIWEPACGYYKISDIFGKLGYGVYSTDLIYGQNFLFDDDTASINPNKTAIITNPPFSLKKEFFHRCLYYKAPFALLIPTDYCKWLIEAVDKFGAEKIIPTNRISYITPNTIKRINKRYSTSYENINEVPHEYLVEDFSHSGAQFHSMWLTWGFGLGKTETFVELTKEMMKEI
jgi:hypothetical protein